MVMLINTQMPYSGGPIKCRSRNRTHHKEQNAVVRLAFGSGQTCRWAAYTVVCPVVERPLSFKIGHTGLSVPYREPVERKIGVVACFSPLFYYERWQLIIATLEIYRQFGVGVQTYYIQSMVAEVFEFLKVYERRGLVDIQTWANIVLGDQGLDYNPNEELEWRNQASAHTDCLLKYKQAAEFIIVADIDDILFPRLGSKYIGEFRRLAARAPTAASFSYNRYNADFVTSMFRTKDPPATTTCLAWHYEGTQQRVSITLSTPEGRQ
ncbi:Protein F13G3.3 b [Aphelenchoides avenae]|nr:Protein F13G3.3 b [Aphelenchus avenae]